MKDYAPIKGRDYDGAYRSSDVVRYNAADRRRLLAREGNCINGRSHGPATHGVRCERCAEVHRRSW